MLMDLNVQDNNILFFQRILHVSGLNLILMCWNCLVAPVFYRHLIPTGSLILSPFPSATNIWSLRDHWFCRGSWLLQEWNPYGIFTCLVLQTHIQIFHITNYSTTSWLWFWILIANTAFHAVLFKFNPYEILIKIMHLKKPEGLYSRSPPGPLSFRSGGE